MRKLAFFGLLVAVAIVIGLLVQSHTKVSRDKNLREKLVGAWEWRYANIWQTYSFSTDGSYTIEDVTTYSDRTNIFQESGTWQIKDGKIVHTITNDNHKRARVPRTNSASILQLDAKKWVVGIGTNTMELNRVTP